MFGREHRGSFPPNVWSGIKVLKQTLNQYVILEISNFSAAGHKTHFLATLSLSLPLTRYGESLRQMIWWSEQRKLGTRISLKRKKHV